MGVGGLLPHPQDLCDLQYMCNCIFDLLIWVPGCCVCQLDKKMTGFCTFFVVTQSWQWLSIVCGQQEHCPSPIPLSHFLTHGQGAEQLACPW